MPRRAQIAFRLEPATMTELDELTESYGSRAAVVRAAVHLLYERQHQTDGAMAAVRHGLASPRVAEVLETTPEQLAALDDEAARQAYERFMEWLR